ncbi:MAG: GNAT family N-acetyltransferase [Hyphomicrobiaceae bacterium]
MTEIRRATLDDLKYLDALRKKEGDALGFIPMQRYEMEVNGERHGSVYLAWDNDDPTGFIYATHSGRGTTHIIQVAIQEDARRMERASALVGAVVDDGLRRRSWLTSLRCADDLEAGHFWAALGFSLEQEGVWPKSPNSPGREKRAINRRGRLINVWQRVECGLFAPPEAGSS